MIFDRFIKRRSSRDDRSITVRRDNTKPYTRAQLAADLLSDLGQRGFVRKDNKSLWLSKADKLGTVTVRLEFEVVPRATGSPNQEREANIVFYVYLEDSPLPARIMPLWSNTGEFHRNDILDLPPPREPYTFATGDQYSDSELHADVIDFGADLLTTLCNRDIFYDYLLCRDLVLPRRTLQGNATLQSRRNRLAMGLYIFTISGNKELADEAFRKFQKFAAASEDNFGSVRALMRWSEMAELVSRRDPAWFELLAQPTRMDYDRALLRWQRFVEGLTSGWRYSMDEYKKGLSERAFIQDYLRQQTNEPAARDSNPRIQIDEQFKSLTQEIDHVPPDPGQGDYLWWTYRFPEWLLDKNGKPIKGKIRKA